MTWEEEIKQAWANYKLPWPCRDGVPLPFLNVANHGPTPTNMWDAPTNTKTAPEQDVFVFELEDGFHEGKPATRVVCAGVVVDISYRSR